MRSTDYGRHIPASHPVLRRTRFMERVIEICEASPAPPHEGMGSLALGPPVDLPVEGRLPGFSAAALARMTDRLDHLALLVFDLPDQPLTVGQQRLAKALATELMRRATTEPTP